MGFKMIFVLLLENEIIIKNYHQPILNRIRKEIVKGNRNFKETKITDVEFMSVFNNDLEKFKDHLKKGRF